MIILIDYDCDRQQHIYFCRAGSWLLEAEWRQTSLEHCPIVKAFDFTARIARASRHDKGRSRKAAYFFLVTIVLVLATISINDA